MSDKHDDEELTDFGLAEDEPNDADRRHPSLWKRYMHGLNFGLGMVVRVVIVIGGILTYIQYNHAVKREQVQRAFELVDLWQSERIQKSHEAIQAELLKLRGQARVMAEIEGKPSDPAFTQKLINDRLWEEVEAGGTLSTAFFDVVFFLNRASYCATSDLCDRQVIDDFFRDYATQFWAYFGDNLEVSRATDTHPIKLYLERKAK